MKLAIEEFTLLIGLVERQIKFENQMIDICSRALAENKVDNTSDIQSYIDSCNLKIADLSILLDKLEANKG